MQKGRRKKKRKLPQTHISTATNYIKTEHVRLTQARGREIPLAANGKVERAKDKNCRTAWRQLNGVE